ncbi:hypothetical protein BC936DRAFT_139973 [Jimgerdemannia flammicorona]|uniref:F-box domain-containing protein n=1 Tax=Jimgerdemannia flammicorona TaxID=994334 RepID=A0A433B8L8_9FUNG|nr:hypothetical protein BC936DRAFT_139973 [Jimgerdemannia flammicorona]
MDSTNICKQPTHLPPEVLLEILRYLKPTPSGFRNDLFASALVCRAWYLVAHELLDEGHFHTLFNCWNHYYIALELSRFADLLAESQRLGLGYLQLVKELRIEVDREDEFADEPDEISIDDGEPADETDEISIDGEPTDESDEISIDGEPTDESDERSIGGELADESDERSIDGEPADETDERSIKSEPADEADEMSIDDMPRRAKLVSYALVKILALQPPNLSKIRIFLGDAKASLKVCPESIQALCGALENLFLKSPTRLTDFIVGLSLYLESLKLSYIYVGIELRLALRQCTSLHELFYEMTDDSSLATTVAFLPHLRRFRYKHHFDHSDVLEPTVVALGLSCPDLTAFEYSCISGEPIISIGALCSILLRYPHLRHICVEHSDVGNVFLAALVRYGHKLEEIVLRGVRATGEGVLVGNGDDGWPELRKLDVMRCQNLLGGFLARILESCPKLKMLKIPSHLSCVSSDVNSLI